MQENTLFAHLTIDSVLLLSECGQKQTLFCLPWTCETELRKQYAKGTNLNKQGGKPFIVKSIEINYSEDGAK